MRVSSLPGGASNPVGRITAGENCEGALASAATQCKSAQHLPLRDQRNLLNCDTTSLVTPEMSSMLGHTKSVVKITSEKRSARCERDVVNIGMRSKTKKFSQGVHQHLAECGGSAFVMTPFFKIHDSHRDSQTILSYESLLIKRYQPRLNVLKLWICQQLVHWCAAILSGSYTLETALSLFLSHDQFSNWPKQSFLALQTLDQNIEFSLLWFKRKNSFICVCDFLILWFYGLMIIHFHFHFVASYSFLMSRKVKHVRWNNLIQCFNISYVLYESILFQLKTRVTHIWTVSFF